MYFLGVEGLVAKDKDEYVRIALEMGTNPEARKAAREQVFGSNGKDDAAS